MEKKILEFKVEEKDGEYVIRIKGEKAEHFATCLTRCCCHSHHPGDKSRADASCC